MNGGAIVAYTGNLASASSEDKERIIGQVPAGFILVMQPITGGQTPISPVSRDLSRTTPSKIDCSVGQVPGGDYLFFQTIPVVNPAA